jgi:alcohol dehydrogenase YqhD (iron-dependent ADH family)
MPPRRLSGLVRERYPSERQLRGRVDAYVRLFERLLDTVSDTPNGDKVAEACLAADSGKVYLLLAQASGRIPPQTS